MHSYKEQESHLGSRFFIQSSTENRYLFSVEKTEEEYCEEFLEIHIRNTYLVRFTTFDDLPGYTESNELCNTIKYIIFDYLEKNKSIVKIEIDHRCTDRKDLIKKFYNENRPNHIKGLSHLVNGITVYYFFNKNYIDSDDVIAALVKEFSVEDNNANED